MPIFFGGIQAQLDEIYTEPASGPGECLSLEEKEEEEEEEIPLLVLNLISADCLERDWGTRHMTLAEIQREAGLGHVSYSTVFRALHSRGIKAYVEECKFILNEHNKKRRMVSASGYYCDS